MYILEGSWWDGPMYHDTRVDIFIIYLIFFSPICHIIKPFFLEILDSFASMMQELKWVKILSPNENPKFHTSFFVTPFCEQTLFRTFGICAIWENWLNLRNKGGVGGGDESTNLTSFLLSHRLLLKREIKI